MPPINEHIKIYFYLKLHINIIYVVNKWYSLTVLLTYNDCFYFLTFLRMMETRSKRKLKYGLPNTQCNKQLGCMTHCRRESNDSHGEVGDESRGGKVHLKGRLLGDGQLVPYWTLDGGNSIAGHHRTPHMVVSHLQLATPQIYAFISQKLEVRSEAENSFDITCRCTALFNNYCDPLNTNGADSSESIPYILIKINSNIIQFSTSLLNRNFSIWKYIKIIHTYNTYILFFNGRVYD